MTFQILALSLTLSLAHANADKLEANAEAKSVAPKREPARASVCPNLKSMQAEYAQLNPTKTADREKGEAGLGAVAECLQSFASVPVELSGNAFAQVVPLVANALPFDPETSLADGIADLIAKPKLEDIFQGALAGIEVCHRNFLVDNVYGRICQGKALTTNRYCAPRAASDISCLKKLFPEDVAKKNGVN